MVLAASACVWVAASPAARACDDQRWQKVAAQPRTARPAPPSVLRTIAAVGWRLEPALAALPPRQLAQTVELEEFDYDEDQFDGGALRVYVNRPSGGGEIFAVLADSRAAAYRAFADLQSSNAYTVYRYGPYAVVLPDRPVPRPLFAKLKTRQWSSNDLHRLVGTPSFDWHVHGVGHSGFTYVPQGLVFALDRMSDVTGIVSRRRYQLDDGSNDIPPLKSLARIDYAEMSRDVRGGFANELLCDREQIDRELATGTASPDGRMIASPVNLIGLANTE